MTGELHIAPMGALLALAFVLSMGGLMWWMFKLPKYVPQEAAVTRHAVAALKRILVPTVGQPYSERGVELACRLGQEQQADHGET